MAEYVIFSSDVLHNYTIEVLIMTFKHHSLHYD